MGKRGASVRGLIVAGASLAVLAALAASAADAQAAAAPIAAQAATPAAAQGDDQAAAASANSLSEIVVTAQRREEKAQSVPISITAFSPRQLQQQNITKGQDLAATVPSLVVGPNGQASRDTQSFTIRGQGATFQASPGVVVYLNEVPLPAPITLSQQGGPGNFVDLENLQVLAGPQGTLFGRNTTGGAVLLVPKKPTNKFEGYLEGKYGNYDDKELQGAINLPIVDDKLMVRVSGAYQDRDGYTKDLTYDRHLDNQHWYSGRIGVTWRPSDRFENYLMAYGAHSRFNGTGIVNIGLNIPAIQGVGFCVDPPLTPPGPSGIAVRCDVYRNATAQAQADGPRAVRPSVRELQKTETWGVEDTAKFNLTDNLALRNIVSFQRFKSFYYYDGDGTPLQQYDASYTTFPYPRDHIKNITEELQLQGNAFDNHLVFTVGGFYYHQLPAGTQGVDAINYCPAAFTGFCQPQRTFIGIENKSEALYAQGTLDLGLLDERLNNLKLTGGFRYTWDRIDGFSTSWTPQANGSNVCANNGVTVPAGTDPYQPCYFDGHLRSHAPTWTVGLDYKVARSVLVFAKVSRGYKAGGFNTYSVFPNTRVFDPEIVTSYEGGIKSDFHLGSMPARLNVSYYYSRYSNIQRATGDFNLITNASGARINAAKARIQGVEVEGTIKPFRMLEIGGNFSYTDAKYTKYLIAPNGLPDCTGALPAPGAQANLKCLPFQYVSPYIFSVHANLDVPLSDRVGDLNVYANYSYTSHQYTDPDILPQFQPGDRLEAYSLLNLSVDLNKVAGTNFDLGVFMTNATNKLFRISNDNTYNNLLASGTIYGEPRMYGVRLRYHFG